VIISSILIIEEPKREVIKFGTLAVPEVAVLYAVIASA
jgi:hypothetical protein